MVLKPEKEEMARKIFEKWELSFATIGHITDTGRLILRWHGEVAADLPIAPMSEDAPVYDRPWMPTPKREEVKIQNSECKIQEALLKLIACPDIASKRWIWRQYDHMVMNDTLARPGGDAAVVRVHGTGKALAITTDCTPRYVYADPVEGGKQAVAESWRNLTAVGAKPLAITNCLNFGNPQRPEIMGQIVGAIQGMREACLRLDYPVISGNVSLYNETNGVGVQPTPNIGGVGILKDYGTRVGNAFTAEGLSILLIGETKGHLGASLYLREIENREEGAPPPVNLDAEVENGNFVRRMIQERRIAACHDLSDGGLLVALAEMCLPCEIGANIEFPEGAPPLGYAFGEDQARYLLAVAPEHLPAVIAEAQKAGIPCFDLGKTGGAKLAVEGQLSVSVSELKKLNEDWLPGYMAGR